MWLWLLILFPLLSPLTTKKKWKHKFHKTSHSTACYSDSRSCSKWNLHKGPLLVKIKLSYRFSVWARFSWIFPQLKCYPECLSDTFKCEKLNTELKLLNILLLSVLTVQTGKNNSMKTSLSIPCFSDSWSLIKCNVDNWTTVEEWSYKSTNFISLKQFFLIAVGLIS